MSQIIPKALQDVIEALGKLPGVGPRSAERFASYLLRADQKKSKDIAEALIELHDAIDYCQKTFALVEKGAELSRLYSDPDRNKQVVVVVADPFDIVAIEKTNQFKGTYHVLGGLVSPIDGLYPENLRIPELVKRIDEDGITEIILATNASVEGESTALYIKQAIGDRKVKVSRLAQGLPIGVDIEYADQLTLIRALEHRQTI